MKNSNKKQKGVLTSYRKDSELVTRLSFRLYEFMQKKESLSATENSSVLLTIFTEFACPEKKQLAEQTDLSRFNLSRRTYHLSDNIKKTLTDRLKSCAAFSLAMDNSRH